MSDTRDPRHEAGQAHIDHLMSRYSSAKESKAKTGDYNRSDVLNVKDSGLMTPKELNTDFPEFKFKDKKSKGMKSGGKVSSASKRADGIAVKGKTKGRMV